MIKSRKNIPIRAVFYVVILIFVMIQVYPIFWVICSSLKTPDEMTYTAQYALPSGFYLGNYISALTISSIPRYFLNSTVVAVLTLLGIVVLGCPVAFVISKVKVKYANALMAKKLAACLSQHDYDIIVTPHLYPAETMTYMKKKGMLKIPAAAIGTDYTCIPFWEETDLDAYFLPHEDCVSEYVHRGIPADRLYPYGIPVSGAFSPAEDRILAKMHARNALNLPQGVPICLVMSGSMGFGKLAIFAAELSLRLKSGEHMVIICGNNKRIYTVLQKQFQNNPRVHILGYTNRVADYMDACDVIFTKPGGLTSTEALVKRIPIVHTAPIPGCETANRNFFVKRHLSVSSKYIAKQITLGKRLLSDTQDPHGNRSLREEMLLAQKENGKPDAAVHIIKTLEKL